jgi:hypothetical protein
LNNVSLQVLPDILPMSWESFCSLYGRNSIAIDGFVAEQPRFDPKLPAANFNHHEGVSRLETRATSAQVLLAVRMGLFRAFRKDGIPAARVFANDCDEDVCLSCFILSNGPICESLVNPRLNRLVDVAELMDTTAGMYPLSPDFEVSRQLAWIFAPYRDFRHRGGLDRHDGKEFLGIVEQVISRIQAHIVGNGGEMSLDLSYARIGGGPGWTMIRELGAHGRTGAVSDGIKAFVSVRERDDGKWAYSVGRLSEFIPFPVPEILYALEQQEVVKQGEPTKASWGGATTIGGSPRPWGSVLSPPEVERIINLVLQPI